MVSCDTHAIYYAALMAAHNPLKLRQPIAGIDHEHSWMNGSVHFYFYPFCAQPTKPGFEMVEGFQITKVWDRRCEVAEAFAGVFTDRPRVCETLEEASEGVDLVFLGDCNGDGSDHLVLATPGLEKGIATFIDKPLANEVEDMKKILALAKKYRAPLFSASILRHIPGAFQFRSRLPEIGRAESGAIRCPGHGIPGYIHTISLAQAVFGGGIEEVSAMGPGELGVMHLSWGNREDRPPSGVVIHHNVRENWHCSSHVTAYGKGGAILSSSNINDWFFPLGATRILEKIRTMALTGEVDESMNDMIEAVAVVNAGRLSMKSGSRLVKVAEVFS